MPTVTVEPGSFEEALSSFMRKCAQEKIIKKTRDRMSGGKRKGKRKSNA